MVVVPDGVFYNFRRDVVALVNEARLPAIYPERDYADDGGLMVYGANVTDNFRRAAGYVDRILKGAKRYSYQHYIGHRRARPTCPADASYRTRI